MTLDAPTLERLRRVLADPLHADPLDLRRLRETLFPIPVHPDLGRPLAPVDISPY